MYTVELNPETFMLKITRKGNLYVYKILFCCHRHCNFLLHKTLFYFQYEWDLENEGNGKSWQDIAKILHCNFLTLEKLIIAAMLGHVIALAIIVQRNKMKGMSPFNIFWRKEIFIFWTTLVKVCFSNFFNLST